MHQTLRLVWLGAASKQATTRPSAAKGTSTTTTTPARDDTPAALSCTAASLHWTRASSSPCALPDVCSVLSCAAHQPVRSPPPPSTQLQSVPRFPSLALARSSLAPPPPLHHDVGAPLTLAASGLAPRRHGGRQFGKHPAKGKPQCRRRSGRSAPELTAVSIQIQIARRDAEALKDRIKRKKDELADTTRKSMPLWCSDRDERSRADVPYPFQSVMSPRAKTPGWPTTWKVGSILTRPSESRTSDPSVEMNAVFGRGPRAGMAD